jgi:hypothetical protein
MNVFFRRLIPGCSGLLPVMIAVPASGWALLVTYGRRAPLMLGLGPWYWLVLGALALSVLACLAALLASVHNLVRRRPPKALFLLRLFLNILVIHWAL